MMPRDSRKTFLSDGADRIQIHDFVNSKKGLDHFRRGTRKQKKQLITDIFPTIIIICQGGNLSNNGSAFCTDARVLDQVSVLVFIMTSVASDQLFFHLLLCVPLITHVSCYVNPLKGYYKQYIFIVPLVNSNVSMSEE